MDFPRLVFTSPGPNSCNGGTYGYELVKDEGEYESALKAGFFGSVPEALSKKAAKAPELKQEAKPEDKPEADQIDALRAKAEALGIAVDRRWGEAKLIAEIAKAKEA
jgi:hypothetical protein